MVAFFVECKMLKKSWFYDYKFLRSCDQSKVRKTYDGKRIAFLRLAEQWSDELNSEWISRCYLAIKMIMSATIQYNSSVFSEEKNIRVVVPYLNYYASLSMCRAVVLLSPDCKWGGGKLFAISHHDALVKACENLKSLDSGFAHSARSYLLELKEDREYISYKAPTSGDRNLVSDASNIIDLLRAFAEIAQFYSEILQEVLDENLDCEYKFLDDNVYDLADVLGRFDREDWYRADYMRRKSKRPYSLNILAKEGHVDDFFGSWCEGDGHQEGNFDPDLDIRVIFSLP